MILLVLLATLLIGISIGTFAYYIVPAWDEISERFLKDLMPRVDALNMERDQVKDLMRWWGISICAGIFLIGVLWGKFIIAIGITLFALTIPRFVLDLMIDRRRIQLRDQLVTASIGLANTCRAGLTLPQGITSIAPDIPNPLGKEFRRIVINYESGLPLKQALREVKNRLDLESFNVFSSSVLVALEQGGNISQALEKISEGLAELQRLERKIESVTAGGKKLAFFLAMFPPAFLLGFYLLDPVSVGLMFNWIVGQVILVVIGLLVFLAVRWCHYILDIEV